MRIVHIEDFIHPDAGYQLNLLSRLQVRQGHEVFIVTSEFDKIPDFLTEFFGKNNIKEKDKKFFQSTGVKILRVPIFTYYSGRSVFYPRLFKIVDSLKPDVAFVHSEDTLTGILYILRASRLKYPIVLDCHMIEMASVNPLRKIFRIIYKSFITPRIIKNNIPLIRVVDVDYVEKCLGIPLERTILLSFGTDTEYFKPDNLVYYNFRKHNGIDKDSFVILYAGKLDDSKGGLFFAESIKDKLHSSSGKKIVFLIIGNTAGDYGKSVEEVFSKSKNKIFRFPTQAYLDLAKYYQIADLSIFPKQCSMSFFEVQSSGLPVLFENNQVNIQRAQFGNGLLFNPGDMGDFRLKIIKFADMDVNIYQAMKNNARNFIVENYNYVPIAEKFTSILEKEVLRYKQIHGNS